MPKSRWPDSHLLRSLRSSQNNWENIAYCKASNSAGVRAPRSNPFWQTHPKTEGPMNLDSVSTGEVGVVLSLMKYSNIPRTRTLSWRRSIEWLTARQERRWRYNSVADGLWNSSERLLRRSACQQGKVEGAWSALEIVFSMMMGTHGNEKIRIRSCWYD